MWLQTLWYIYNSLPSYCGIFMIPSLIMIPLWYIYDSLPIFLGAIRKGERQDLLT